jgi:hypothetical protein
MENRAVDVKTDLIQGPHSLGLAVCRYGSPTPISSKRGVRSYLVPPYHAIGREPSIPGDLTLTKDSCEYIVGNVEWPTPLTLTNSVSRKDRP